MKNKSTNKKRTDIIIKLDEDSPYQSIHNRLKRLRNYEKEVLVDLYLAVGDAVQYRNDNITAISEMDEYSVEEKNKNINEELDIIKSYEIWEDILSLVIGGKFFEKIGLWVKRTDEDNIIKFN